MEFVGGVQTVSPPAFVEQSSRRPSIVTMRCSGGRLNRQDQQIGPALARCCARDRSDA